MCRWHKHFIGITMNKFRIGLLVGLFLLLTCFAHSQVKYGNLAVKDNRRLEHWPMFLNGTWQLYIDKMLPTVSDTWTVPPDAYVAVPGVWNYTMHKIGHSVNAVCTYRILITRLKPSVKYAFYVKDSPGTAVSIYSNGEFVVNVGTVSEDLSKAKAGRKPIYEEIFSDNNGNIELIFQVSNHNYRKGGIWDSVRFGEANCVYREFCLATGMRFYIFVNLLVLALYNLMMFLLDTRRISVLFYSLFVLMIGLRIFVADFSILALMFPNVSFSVQYKLEYMTLWAGPMFFTMFSQGEYSNYKRWKISSRVILILGAIIGACCTLPPIHIANQFVQILLIYACGVLLYILIVAIYGLRIGKTKTYILIADLAIILFGGVIDILITKVRTLFPVMLMPYAMMLFAIFQFVCISLEQSRIFTKHKTLVAELQELNEAYVRFVPKEFLHILNVRNLLKDVYLGNHVDVEMSIVFSQMYFEPYDGCQETDEEEKTHILSRFFRRVSLQISDSGGFVSKFIAQGFMALFPNNPEDAIECCENIVHALNEINIKRYEENKSLLRIGMGVHYGRMILGMIGEEHRLDDTVISDTVNTASRIESYAEKQKLSVVVSETIVNKTQNADQDRYYPLGEIRVKGKAMPLLLSEYRV